MITVVSHIDVDTKLAQDDILDRCNMYKTYRITLCSI